MGDGRIVLCDGNTGELLAYQDGDVSTYARTGGSPWGTVLGSDGAIYVTQGGNVPGSGNTSAISGIQRVGPDGSVELLFSEVAGYKLYGPNGRLYFTESGSEQDFRFDVRAPGRLFAVDGSGGGEMLLELPGVYPNGIAFDAQQRLYWTESMAHRVCRMGNGEPVTFCQLSDEHVPDGMAFAADGRLFVATTVSQGVTVISAEGDVLEEIRLGEHATNCIFDGPALYVTATREPDIEASARTGTFWRVETNTTGLDQSPASCPSSSAIALGIGRAPKKSTSSAVVSGVELSGSARPTPASASARPSQRPTSTMS